MFSIAFQRETQFVYDRFILSALPNFSPNWPKSPKGTVKPLLSYFFMKGNSSVNTSDTDMEFVMDAQTLSV